MDSSNDRRIDYIHQAISFLYHNLREYGSSIKTFFDDPLQAFQFLVDNYDVDTVYCNTDYEPYAMARDQSVESFLKKHSIIFLSYKDQVIFHKNDILKTNGEPYTVFTPYAEKWKDSLKHIDLNWYALNMNNFIQRIYPAPPSLLTLGFKITDVIFNKPEIIPSKIIHYHLYSDFPGFNATTHLGSALRFGTISVRDCVQAGLKYSSVWLNQLIWREFFMQILFHFPHVEHSCFKKEFENIPWRNNEKEFELWCSGQTGYPIVDAGMRELNKTGCMHNRVRMIVASFLCKHLLIDWRWGEAYFASKLLDYELASNNGNWQWAAGCGCDAVPYFRIFNPVLQAEKFDPDKTYVRKWLSEDEEKSVPKIVDHAFARERALQVYRKALRKS